MDPKLAELFGHTVIEIRCVEARSRQYEQWPGFPSSVPKIKSFLEELWSRGRRYARVLDSGHPNGHPREVGLIRLDLRAILGAAQHEMCNLEAIRNARFSPYPINNIGILHQTAPQLAEEFGTTYLEACRVEERWITYTYRWLGFPSFKSLICSLSQDFDNCVVNYSRRLDMRNPKFVPDYNAIRKDLQSIFSDARDHRTRLEEKKNEFQQGEGTKTWRLQSTPSPVPGAFAPPTPRPGAIAHHYSANPPTPTGVLCGPLPQNPPSFLSLTPTTPPPTGRNQPSPSTSFVASPLTSSPIGHYPHWPAYFRSE